MSRIRVRQGLVLATAIAGCVLVGGAGAGDVAADHCGASMDISPASGAGGTTFLIEPNLGDRTVLRLFRNDRLVLTTVLADPALRYAFTSRSGDAGAWRAEAKVANHPSCKSAAGFRITGLPSTSILAPPGAPAGSTGPNASALVLVAAALAGATAGWYRARRGAA